ncbi:MAG: PAS domain S-box protein [Candidatus Heimdallarchaeota archaeon]
MKPLIRILHLEDNKNDAELVKETLLMKEINCEIIHVDNEKEFIKNLENNTFDVILADYNLPSFDGFTALALSQKLAPDIPFIFISGVLGEELAIETLKRGATDYVIKSRLERLVPSIERALREQEEKAKRILLEREIVELDQMIGELRSVYQQLTKRVRGFLKIELPSGNYSIVDKFLEDLSGYQIKDWQDTPNFINQIIHPDFQDYYNENLEQFKQGIVPKMLEYKIKRKDEEERWWLQFNLGAFDAEGQLTSISAVIIDNTEDKEAQQKYQDLFENAVTGMYRSDIQTGEFLEANEKMAELFGCTTIEDLKKLRAADFYVEEDTRNSLVEKLLEKGFYEEEIVQIKKVDGTSSWVSESASIYLEEGYIQGILIDVTERKKAQDALIRDRKAFQLIAEAAVQATTSEELCQVVLDGLAETFSFDAGTIRLYNPEDEMLYPIAIFGVTVKEKEKLEAISLHEESHVGAHVARTKQAIFAPDIMDSNFLSSIPPQLQNFSVRANITWPIITVGDELLGILQLVNHTPKMILEGDRTLFATIADMLASALEYRKAEDALRDSEEKFRAFAEQSLLGVILTNSEGDFLYINNVIIEISEYTREDFESSNIRDMNRKIFSLQDMDRLRNQFAVIRGDNPTTSKIEEYQATTRSGKTKWVAVHLTPIRIKDEIATGIVILEITKQKRVQLTLERERKAFHLLAEATVNAKDLTDLCQRILTGLTELLQYDNGTFRLYDKEKDTLVPIAVVLEDMDKHSLIKPLALSDKTYLNTHVARTKEPIFAPDATKHPITKQYQERLKTFDAQANITWPILDVSGELLGTLQIVSNKTKEIPSEDIIFFETIVKFFATALERMWSQEALRESQELYSRLIETSPFSIINTDLEGKIITLNQQALNILGISKEEEIQGSDFFTFISLEDRAKAKLDVHLATEKGILRNVEYSLLNKIKQIIPFETSISVILNDEQEAEAYIFIGQDISLRKEIEEQRMRLTNIISHSEQVITSIDPKGTLIYANPAVEKVFGFTPEELIGQHVSIMSPPGQENQQKEMLKQVKAKDKITFETLRKHKDGKLVPVIMNLTTNRDEQGDIISINGIFLDITDIKKLEETLRSRYQEFEVLNKIISAGYKAENLEQLFDFVLNTILSSLNFTGGAIYILNHNNKNAELKRSIGMPKSFTKDMEIIDINSPQYKQLFVAGETYILENFGSVEQHSDVGGIQSIISVPFFSKNAVIGALLLSSKEQRTISSENQSVLEAIGRDIGTAIAKFIAEKELLAKQLSLMNIFDALDELLVVIDCSSGRLVMVNNAAKEEFDLSDKKLLTKTISDLHATSAEDDSIEKILSKMNNKSGEFTLPLRTSDGKITEYRISYFLYTINNRDVFVCILR